MRTILRTSWTILRRDKVALLLTFLLPIIFFSIFGSIFAGAQAGKDSVLALQLLVADMDESSLSTRMIDVLGDRSEIDVIRAQTAEPPAANADGSAEEKAKSTPGPLIADGEAARSAVRRGKYDAALLIPKGFGDSFPDFAQTGPAIQLYYDSANPMAQPSVVGLLQAASFQAAPDSMLDKGLDMLETSGLNFTEEQQEVIETAKSFLRDQVSDLGSESDGTASEPAQENSGTNQPAGGMASFLRVEASPARAPTGDAQLTKKRNRMISYYAASIGVMFLLFSTTAAAGSLLDEQDGGTLDRLLTSNLTMNTLLLSRWVFYSTMGFLQLVLMFLWGKWFFGLDLFTLNHTVGAITIAAFTAFAASAFGMLLATLSRTRAQMNGVSTIVILVMSAIGGSMIPRFVMPISFQKLSKFTFNGWAIDGFLKVFWYDDPADGLMASVVKLWPEVLALSLMTVGFMLVARKCARRWEAV